MTALTFDHPPTSVRRRASRRARPVNTGAPVAMVAPVASSLPSRSPIGPVCLVSGIAALHMLAVLSLSDGRATPAVSTPVPIAISFVPLKVEPPPPPPPPEPAKPRPVLAPRVQTVARPVPAPATALPIAAPTATSLGDTVQVAAAPVEPAAPPPQAAPEPVTEPRGYAGYLKNPAPDYPLSAQKRGLEGQVILKVYVLASGQPDSVAVAKSSGHPILDEAALKAVQQWAFAPARRGKTAIDGWVQVPLNFRI